MRLNWVYEGTIRPEWRDHAVRGAPSLSAWLVLRGSAEVHGGGETLAAQANDWLIPPLPPRHQHFSDDARILSVGFHLFWPSGEPLFSRVGFVFPSSRFPQLERNARRLLRALSSEMEISESTVTLEAYLRLQKHFPAWIESFVAALQSLGCKPSRLKATDERMLRAMTVLDEWTGVDDDGPRQAAAAAAGLSPSQLDRLFVLHFGLTPRAWLDRRKIQSACLALESSRTSGKEIGYGLGFKQPSHFAAWFRSRQGQSPSTYRATRIGRRT
jgi:AraC-like DNA-binding protein